MLVNTMLVFDVLDGLGDGLIVNVFKDFHDPSGAYRPTAPRSFLSG